MQKVFFFIILRLCFIQKHRQGVKMVEHLNTPNHNQTRRSLVMSTQIISNDPTQNQAVQWLPQANDLRQDFKACCKEFERQLANWANSHQPEYPQGYANRVQELQNFLDGFHHLFDSLISQWIKKYTADENTCIQIFNKVGFNFEETFDRFYKRMIKKYAFTLDEAIETEKQEYGYPSWDDD